MNLIPSKYQCKSPYVSIVRWMACFLLVLSLTTISPNNAASQGPDNKDSLKLQLQVAMAYKILGFIQWPANSFGKQNNTFRIGVLGNNPILDPLKILEQETIKSLQVKVELVENTNNAKNFHLLYVCPTLVNEMPSIVRATKDAKTLTISKATDFAKKGGMINFYEDRGKMRFEINLEQARRSGFKISSRVLSLSKIIKSEN